MTAVLNRRRFLAISAAALGLTAAPMAMARARAGSAGGRHMHRWTGAALGADASILLHHPDAGRARALLGECLGEIARLEAVFSIYRADSALSRLNRNGALDAPPLELVHLLTQCRRFSRLSAGAFDVSVQPLYELHARYKIAGAKPSAGEIAAVRALVDYRKIEISGRRIALAGDGMALTLNGIAQGYITDRVAELLRARGMGRVLVNLGEIRGLGHHPSGRPWNVALQDPPGQSGTARQIDLVDGAVATSAAHGHWFGAPGGRHHLFDPASGNSSMRHASVSVTAPSATVADALSTALSILPLDRAGACLNAAALAVAPATAYFTELDGTRHIRRGGA